MTNHAEIILHEMTNYLATDYSPMKNLRYVDDMRMVAEALARKRSPYVRIDVYPDTYDAAYNRHIYTGYGHNIDAAWRNLMECGLDLCDERASYIEIRRLSRVVPHDGAPYYEYDFEYGGGYGAHDLGVLRTVAGGQLTGRGVLTAWAALGCAVCQSGEPMECMNSVIDRVNRRAHATQMQVLRSWSAPWPEVKYTA